MTVEVYFEELAPHKRAGGIETACTELTSRLSQLDVSITRSADSAWNKPSLPGCVHIQGLWSPTLAKNFWRWRKLGVPCVVSPHGMLTSWALEHKYFRKKIAWHLYQKSILNRAAVLHATSVTEAEQFAKLGLKTQTYIIPWGVTIPAVDVSKNGHSPTVRTAVFAGRLCPIKGLPMLFDAWQRVRPVDWKLRVIGPDEAGYRASLESIVREKGIDSSVTFEGAFSKADLQRACLDADLFVLPSYSENFGLVVGEALAVGTPVLTTCGTPWQRIADTNCGWWVPPTTEAIVPALQAATAMSSGQLRQMGSIGAALVRKEFSWDVTVEKFRDMYTQLAGHSR